MTRGEHRSSNFSGDANYGFLDFFKRIVNLVSISIFPKIAHCNCPRNRQEARLHSKSFRCTHLLLSTC